PRPNLMPAMIRRILAATLVLTALTALTACAPTTSPPLTPPSDKLVLQPTTFAALNAWSTTGARAALSAFAASCAKLMQRADADSFGGAPDYGTVAEWRPACSASLNSADMSEAGARGFFDTWFTPALATNNG